jgi:hypothetical protein
MNPSFNGKKFTGWLKRERMPLMFTRKFAQTQNLICSTRTKRSLTFLKPFIEHFRTQTGWGRAYQLLWAAVTKIDRMSHYFSDIFIAHASRVSCTIITFCRLLNWHTSEIFTRMNLTWICKSDKIRKPTWIRKKSLRLYLEYSLLKYVSCSVIMKVTVWLMFSIATWTHFRGT